MLAAKIFVLSMFFVLSMLAVLIVGTAAEAAKEEACDTRLGKSILYEKIVEKGRLDGERALAAEQLKVKMLESYVEQLQHELAELKKPKTEEKKAP